MTRPDLDALAKRLAAPRSSRTQRASDVQTLVTYARALEKERDAARAAGYKLGYFNGWHAGKGADYNDNLADAREPE